MTLTRELRRHCEPRFFVPLDRRKDRPPVVRPLDDAGRALVVSELPLAHKLAWYFARKRWPTVPADEFIGEALWALCRAVGTFDADRGVPFGAFATVAIRRHLEYFARKWINRQAAQFDDGRRRDGRHETSPVDPSPDRATAAEQAAADVDRVRKAMPARWFDVLFHRANGMELEAIGQAIGGVTRQRVRQIHRKATRKAQLALRGGLEVRP